MAGLDPVPQQPPEVTGQMGGVPFAGVGRMMSDQQKAGAANPEGSLVAAGEAIEKVLNNMARMSDKFKPFAMRMLDMLKSGLGEAAGSAPGSPSASAGGPSGAKVPTGVEGQAFPG